MTLIYFYGYFFYNVNLVASVNKVASVATFDVYTFVPWLLTIPQFSLSLAYSCYHFTKVTSVHWLVLLHERATYHPFCEYFVTFYSNLFFCDNTNVTECEYTPRVRKT